MISRPAVQHTVAAERLLDAARETGDPELTARAHVHAALAQVYITTELVEQQAAQATRRRWTL